MSFTTCEEANVQRMSVFSNVSYEVSAVSQFDDAEFEQIGTFIGVARTLSTGVIVSNDALPAIGFRSCQSRAHCCLCVDIASSSARL